METGIYKIPSSWRCQDFSGFMTGNSCRRTIITMDYPVLSKTSGVTGILAIDQYLDAIAAEQNFLQRFSEEYVKGILMRFQKDYQSQFF